MSNNQTNKNYISSVQNKRANRFMVELDLPMIFCAVEAIVLFAVCAILHLFLKTNENAELISYVTVFMFPFYLLSAGIICWVYALRSLKTKRARYDASLFETEVYDMFRYIIDLPYAVCDAGGKVKIMNGSLQDILGYRNAISGISLSEFCSVSIKNIVSYAKNRQTYLVDTIYDMPQEAELHETNVTKLADGRRYEAISYVFKVQGENYYFIVFQDIEDYLSLHELHESESPVVAYIQLDNLQELVDYVRADYRTAVTEAENILKDWISEMNGFIKEQSREKYVAVFSKSQLDEQMKRDFDVQQKIMALKIGDNSFPITVSMGISAVGNTLSEKERAANAALNMAIQRGGNQVAIRREDNTGYVLFGGTHKTIENNTTIVSRVSGEIIEEKVKRASNVLIMGHANPDFDSIGSCIGMARFVMSVIEDHFADKPANQRPTVNVITDTQSESFKIATTQIVSLPDYKDVFIERKVAKDLVDPDTVLIICDVNNPGIYQAPELASIVNHIAVIDHHRMAMTLPFEPFLQYVETTKSSASEIVSEILFYSKYADKLHKEEAEVLLSGIMLDTSNFTRNAGAQTFEATHYLYSHGAHTSVVREFFNESIEELLLTGEFESKARIYKDNIAITWMTIDKQSASQGRVIASKVADNLLHVKGVNASFALVKIGNDVAISGRSKGQINVQLILERLRGGGHFDIAGAQVNNASLTRSCEMLKDAIDDYLEHDYHGNSSEE